MTKKGIQSQRKEESLWSSFVSFHGITLVLFLFNLIVFISNATLFRNSEICITEGDLSREQLEWEANCKMELKEQLEESQKVLKSSIEPKQERTTVNQEKYQDYV